MIPAPHPLDEAARLAALRRLGVLDTPAEPGFDELVAAAAAVCGTPIALVSLVDEERQWFKARVGLTAEQTPRDLAFCAHAILGPDVLEVRDASADARFADNPLVTGDPGIQFYAGAPIQLADGSRVGTLCVIDRVPRALDAHQRAVLQQLSRAASAALELRRDARHHAEQSAELRAERDYLSSVIESTGVGTWRWNIATGATRFNERWAEILGYALYELEPTTVETWTQLVHPTDLQRADERLRRHFDGIDERFECELRARHRRGHWVWIRTVGRVLTRTSAGQPEWMFGTHVDCTHEVEGREALQRARQRLELALEGGNLAVWEYDVRGNYLSWERRIFQLYGLPEDASDLSYDEWLTLIHPDDRARVAHEVSEVVEGRKPYDIKFRIIRPDGCVRYMRSAARASLNSMGRVVALLGTTWDMTDVFELGSELERQHELMHVTLQSIGEAVITTDPFGLITWLNPVAERLTGWRSAEANGRLLEDVVQLVNEESGLPLHNLLGSCLDPVAPSELQGPVALVSRTGQRLAVEETGAPLRDAEGQVLGAVLVLRDVSEQHRLNREMSHRAKHDALTDLVNRQEFELRLARVLEQSKVHGTLHTLLYLDLDQFKLVNDACGHAVGDELLKQLAQMFRTLVRSRDTLARMGGDEFGMILEQCSSSQALRVAQQIYERMDAFRFEHDGRRFRIGASIGLVQIDADSGDLAAVIKAADAACYAAKEAGRNRVHVWNEGDRAIRERSGDMAWATRITQALDDDRFVLYVQPILPLGASTDSGGWNGEALVRMLNADGSLVPPGAFLPAAERFGLAPRLDQWVVRESIRWLSEGERAEQVASLHVNLSACSLADTNFCDALLAELADLAPRLCAKLCFEITETVAIANLTEVASFVNGLRELGACVALDDFGAGASHFGYLKSLKVDIIKVDGQFIKGMLQDPVDDVSVRGFLEVARVLGVRTVAEFVDSEAVLERCRELGFDFAQGYFLGRPEPMADLAAAVAQ